MTDGPVPPRRPLRRDLALAAGVAAALALLLRGAVLEPFLVRSGAMAPTLLPGDVLVVTRLAYGVRLPFTSLTLLSLPPPRRGDVVVFADPTDRSRLLVKRVVGLPGEVVELREQVVLVDGLAQERVELGPWSYLEPGEGGGAPREDTCRRWREALSGGAATAGAGRPVVHDLLQCRRIRAGRREGPFGPVRPGHLLVLGDNRDRSADGREGWEVPVADVVGRGALVGWSWGPGGWWFGGDAGVRIDRLFKPVE